MKAVGVDDHKIAYLPLSAQHILSKSYCSLRVPHSSLANSLSFLFLFPKTEKLITQPWPCLKPLSDFFFHQVKNQALARLSDLAHLSSLVSPSDLVFEPAKYVVPLHTSQVALNKLLHLANFSLHFN